MTEKEKNEQLKELNSKVVFVGKEVGEVNDYFENNPTLKKSETIKSIFLDYIRNYKTEQLAKEKNNED